MFIKERTTVPQIRILPMSKEEFEWHSVEFVQQDYFMNKLQYGNDYKYYYSGKGLIADPGTLILFQYDNKIVASAQLKKNNKEPGISEGYAHNGAFWLEPSTVFVFEPIELWELVKLDPKIKRFSQSKQNLNTDLHKIIDLLKRKTDMYAMSYQEKVNVVDIEDEVIEDAPKPCTLLCRKIF